MCIQWNTVSAVTWRAVHEHIIADEFRFIKGSSALLLQEQQAPQR